MRAYATPVARFSLHRLSREARETFQSQNALVERDVLHMYSRQEMQVWPGVLERVDHVVRHIRASTRLGINPSALQKDVHQFSPRWDDACWGASTHLGHLCRQCVTQSSIKFHSQSKDTHRIYVDRLQIIRIRVIRLLCVVGIECARNLKELLCEVRKTPSW